MFHSIFISGPSTTLLQSSDDQTFTEADKRASAITIGTFGLIILICTLSLPVIGDLATLGKHVKRCCINLSYTKRTLKRRFDALRQEPNRLSNGKDKRNQILPVEEVTCDREDSVINSWEAEKDVWTEIVEESDRKDEESTGIESKRTQVLLSDVTSSNSGTGITDVNV